MLMTRYYFTEFYSVILKFDPFPGITKHIHMTSTWCEINSCVQQILMKISMSNLVLSLLRQGLIVARAHRAHAPMLELLEGEGPKICFVNTLKMHVIHTLIKYNGKSFYE